MARSLKKGPFADASLLKKVDAMNAADVYKRQVKEKSSWELKHIIPIHLPEEI